jgi:hypothetical protein
MPSYTDKQKKAQDNRVRALARLKEAPSRDEDINNLIKLLVHYESLQEPSSRKHAELEIARLSQLPKIKKIISPNASASLNTEKQTSLRSSVRQEQHAPVYSSVNRQSSPLSANKNQPPQTSTDLNSAPEKINQASPTNNRILTNKSESSRDPLSTNRSSDDSSQSSYQSEQNNTNPTPGTLTYRAITANCNNATLGQEASKQIAQQIKKDKADFYVLNCQEVKLFEKDGDPVVSELENNLKKQGYLVKHLSKMNTRTKLAASDTGMACYVIYKNGLQVDLTEREKARRGQGVLGLGVGSDYNKGGLITRFSVKKGDSKPIEVQSISGHLDKHSPNTRLQDWYSIRLAMSSVSVDNWDQLVEVIPDLRVAGYDANTRRDRRGVDPWGTPKASVDTSILSQSLLCDHSYTSSEDTYKKERNSGNLDFVGTSDSSSWESHQLIEKTKELVIQTQSGEDRDHAIVGSPLSSLDVKVSDFDKVKNHLVKQLMGSAPKLAAELNALSNTKSNKDTLIQVHNIYLSKNGKLNLKLSENINAKEPVREPWFKDDTLDTLSKYTIKDRLLAQIGDYGVAEDNRLHPKNLLDNRSRKALYQSREKEKQASKKHREKFIKYLMDEREKDIPEQTKKQRDKLETKDAAIPMDKLLTKKGIELYQLALMEERNSEEYMNAVFIKSTEHYDGPKWKEPIAVPVGGPSGCGKSFSAKAIIKAIDKDLNENNKVVPDSDEGNDVVSIDGGVGREVSQMRKLVIQLANHKGYTYVTDLADKSKALDSVKEDVKKAAMLGGKDKKPLSLVIPETFSKTGGYIKTATDVAKKQYGDDFLKSLQRKYKKQVYYSRIKGEGQGNDEPNPAVVEFKGIQRSAKTDFTSQPMGEYDLNIAPKLICESKAYSAGPMKLSFTAGVKGSKAVEKRYKRLFPEGRVYNIDYDLILVGKKADGHWETPPNDQTTETQAISQRVYDEWLTLNAESRPNLFDYEASVRGDPRFDVICNLMSKNAPVASDSSLQTREHEGLKNLTVHQLNACIQRVNSAVISKPDDLLFDPQGRVITRDTFEGFEHGVTVSFDINQNNDLKQAFKTKLNKIAQDNQIFLDSSIIDVYIDLDNKSNIIPLQQELYFHLRLALRVYQAQLPSDVVIEEDALQAIHDEAMKKVNERVMEELARALPASYKNQGIDVPTLNTELDKARKPLLTDAHQFLFEEMKKNESFSSINLLKSKDIYKHCAERTTATADHLLHLDNHMKLATVISGSDITAHDRDFGVEHLADMQIQAYQYDHNTLMATSRPSTRTQVRVPSLAVKDVETLSKGKIEINYGTLLTTEIVDFDDVGSASEEVLEVYYQNALKEEKGACFIKDEIGTDFYCKIMQNDGPQFDLYKLDPSKVKRLIHQVIQRDVADRLQELSDCHFRDDEPVGDGQKPKAFIYNLLTTLNGTLNPFDSYDESKNFQNESLEFILKGAHQYNQTKKPGSPLCFVQAIGVNGFGKALGYGTGDRLQDEATLMSEMALLHTVYDLLTGDHRSDVDHLFTLYKRSKTMWFSKNNIDPIEIIKQIKEGLKNFSVTPELVETQARAQATALLQQNAASAISAYTSVKKSYDDSRALFLHQWPQEPTDELQKAIYDAQHHDLTKLYNEYVALWNNVRAANLNVRLGDNAAIFPEVSAAALRTVKAQQCLLKMLAHDKHFTNDARLIQAMSVFCEKMSLIGCKSGNERTQAVDSRVALFDSSAMAELDAQLDNFIRPDENENIGDKFMVLERYVDSLCNDNNLYGESTLISNQDQGSSYKGQAKSDHSFNWNTNRLEAPQSVMTNLKQGAGAEEAQSHKGMGKFMADAVKHGLGEKKSTLDSIKETAASALDWIKDVFENSSRNQIIGRILVLAAIAIALSFAFPPLLPGALIGLAATSAIAGVIGGVVMARAYSHDSKAREAAFKEQLEADNELLMSKGSRCSTATMMAVVVCNVNNLNNITGNVDPKVGAVSQYIENVSEQNNAVDTNNTHSQPPNLP